MNREEAILISCSILLIVILLGLFYGHYQNRSSNESATNSEKEKLLNDGYMISENPYPLTQTQNMTTDYSIFSHNVPRNITLFLKQGYPMGFVAVFNDSYSLSYYPEYKSLSWWIW